MFYVNKQSYLQSHTTCLQLISIGRQESIFLFVKNVYNHNFFKVIHIDFGTLWLIVFRNVEVIIVNILFNLEYRLLPSNWYVVAFLYKLMLNRNLYILYF